MWRAGVLFDNRLLSRSPFYRTELGYTVVMSRCFYSSISNLGLVILTLLAPLLYAETTGVDFGAAPAGERWTITTRWDYRVRIDGRYLGYANR